MPGPDFDYDVDIPPGTYTDEQVRHMLSRGMTKIQIEDLRRNIATMGTKFNEALAAITTRLDTMAKVAESQNKATLDLIKESRREHKQEMLEVLASKAEVNALQVKTEAQIKDVDTKVDKMRYGVTVIVATITGAGLVIQYMLTTAKSAQALIGH